MATDLSPKLTLNNPVFDANYEFGISAIDSIAAIIGPQPGNEWLDFNGADFVEGAKYYLWWRIGGTDWKADQRQPIIYVTGEKKSTPGINQVLGVDPRAVVEFKAHGGLEVIGKGKNADGTDIRFRLDLERLPATGTFAPLLVDESSKIGYLATFAEFMALASGDVTQTPAADPGPPVSVAIADIVISSGETLNISLAAFTKSDGTPYPYTVSYNLEGTPAGFYFNTGSMRLSGSKTVAQETTWPLVLVGTVGPGLQAGTVVRRPFNLKVLAAVVAPSFPQPTITQIAAVSIVQGQTTNLQLYVTYPGGITKTGTWSISGLPSGLSINPATGKFPGAPTTPGEYVVTANWRDSDNQTDDMQFAMTITANPVNAWLLAAFFRIDVNTGGVDIFMRIASGTSAVLVAFEALDSTNYTGNSATGSPTGTDSGGAGYWGTAVPSTDISEFNFRAGFYPFSISPKTGGLGAGKSYVVYIKRPGDPSAEDFFFYFNPVQNTPVTPLLTEEPEEGAGTNQLAPPSVGPQSLIAGTAVSKQFDGFTGWLSGETKAFAYSGIPSGVTFAYNTTTGKFDFAALTTGALDATIGVVATGSLGSYGSFSFQVTSTVALSSITTIYRKFFPSSSIGVGGVITSYGNVSFEAVVAGNQIVQYQASNSALPPDTTWYDQPTKNSAGRYGFTFGQLTGGETLTIKFRLKGQTAEIPLTYTVLSPLTNNSTAEIQVYPNGVPGNNLTPNQLQRVGQPDPQNPVVTSITKTWVTGFDGAQWLQVTLAMTSATYGWKTFLNGEPVAGLTLTLPQHTQATIDVMDWPGYDPTVRPTGVTSPDLRKAQIILYTGTPDGTAVTQNT